MTNDSVSAKLPPYPSLSTRKSLSASQLSTLNQAISSGVADVLSLPPSKRDTLASRTFVASYAKDVALQTLEALIWQTEATQPKVERTIRTLVLQLAEALAAELDVQTLVDLAIVYANTNPSRTRALFGTANSKLTSIDFVSPFVLLLQFDNSHGLYALRKTSHCISSLLRIAPPATLRSFAHSKDFILALAKAYQSRLNSLAHSYGGVNLARNSADEWEKIWLETKVAFMNSFHACMVCLLNDVASTSGPALAREAEVTFDIVFALLELNTTAGTPFLDQSILADYQQSYDLMRTLASSFRHAVERDARLDLLEASLQGLEAHSGSSTGLKNPGALKLLLLSSGTPPGIVGRARQGAISNKGKEKATSLATEVAQPVATDPELDLKITQVLDIFPDQPSDYIHDLLIHPSYPFAGNADGAERVIGALLEGTAPPWDEVRNVSNAAAASQKLAPIVPPPIERRNVFDEEDMDLSRLRVGKKSEDESLFLRDRDAVEQMKADILRRAEEFSSSEDEDDKDDTEDDQLAPTAANKIKVLGDGEESDGSASEGSRDDDEERQPTAQIPETILELAYIEDPKVFDRASKGTKVRADLKQKTGWADEQIEGWKIMLERDPKQKERILKKHEWSGNKPGSIIQQHPEASSSAGGRGRGRGRGGNSGRQGRGQGDGGGERGGRAPDNARERAWKEKNKNRARKGGHDRKMARSGAGPPA